MSDHGITNQRDAHIIYDWVFEFLKEHPNGEIHLDVRYYHSGKVCYDINTRRDVMVRPVFEV